MATKKTLDTEKIRKKENKSTQKDAATIVAQKSAALKNISSKNSEISNREDKKEKDVHLQTLMASANDAAANYESNIAALEKEVKELSEKLAKTDEKYKETKASEKAKTKELSQYKKQVDALNLAISGDVAKVLNQLFSVQVKYDDAIDSLDGANRDVTLLEGLQDQYEEKIADLTNEVNDLVAEKALLSSQITKAEEQNVVRSATPADQLEKANQELLEQLAELQKFANEKAAEAEQLRNEHMNASQENEIIKNTLINQENSLETVTQTLTETMNRYEVLRQESQKIKEERRVLTEQLYETKQSLKDSEDKKDTLEQKLNETEESLHQLEAENKRVSALYENSMNEKTRSLSEALAAQMALKKSQEDLVAANDTSENYKNISEKNESLYKNTQNDLITAKQEINEKSQILDQKLTDIAVLKLDVDKLKDQNEQLNSDLITQGQAYQAWKQEFNAQYDAALKAIDKLKEQHDIDFKDKDQQIMDLKAELAQLNKDKSIYDMGRNYIVSDKAVPLLIKQGYDTLNPDYYTKSQIIDVINNLKEENESLKKRIATQSMNNEANNDTAMLDKLQATISFDSLLAENDSLKQKIRELLTIDSKTEELDKTLSDTKKELASLEQDASNKEEALLAKQPDYQKKANDLKAHQEAYQAMLDGGKEYTEKINDAESDEEKAIAEKAYQEYLDKNNQALKALLSEEKELETVKENLIANDKNIVTLKKNISSLKQKQEATQKELDTYINDNYSGQKKEVFLEYREKMFKANQVNKELRKREVFLNELSASNYDINDYIIKAHNYDICEDENQKNALYSELAVLKAKEDIKTYNLILKQINTLNNASQSLLNECKELKDKYL